MGVGERLVSKCHPIEPWASFILLLRLIFLIGPMFARPNDRERNVRPDVLLPV